MKDLEQANKLLDSVFEDINKLTDNFAKMQAELMSNCEKYCFADTDKDVVDERRVSKILSMQLLTIQYSIEIRNLVVTKFTSLLSDQRFVKLARTGRRALMNNDRMIRLRNSIVMKYNSTINSLRNIFRLVAQYNREINDTQKVLNNFLALKTSADAQIT